MGKAIVAHWPSDAVDHLIKTYGLRTMTAKGLLTRKQVFCDICSIKERGYALDDEEFVIGLKCVAGHVMEAAAELSEVIGGHPL